MAGKLYVSLTALTLASVSTGCSAPPSTREQGVLIRAGLGAGTGAIVGDPVGHAAAGVLIGGRVGFPAGRLSVTRSSQERRDYEWLKQLKHNQLKLA